MELELASGYTLTTERAESSYGRPILVAPNGIALGRDDHPPADLDAADGLGWLDAMYTARQIVAGMISEGGPCRRHVDHPLVQKFLVG